MQATMTYLRVRNGIQGKFELGLVGLPVNPDPIQLSGCVRADKGNAKPCFMPLFLCRWRIHCLIFICLSLLSGPCSACDQYDGLGFFTLYTDRSLFLSSLALHLPSLCLIICQNWQKKQVELPSPVLFSANGDTVVMHLYGALSALRFL